jgi:hypothetical protein
VSGEKLKPGIIRRGRGTSAVGSRYRAKASEDVIVDTSVCACVTEN